MIEGQQQLAATRQPALPLLSLSLSLSLCSGRMSGRGLVEYAPIAREPGTVHGLGGTDRETIATLHILLYPYFIS